MSIVGNVGVNSNPGNLPGGSCGTGIAQQENEEDEDASLNRQIDQV